MTAALVLAGILAVGAVDVEPCRISGYIYAMAGENVRVIRSDYCDIDGTIDGTDLVLTTRHFVARIPLPKGDITHRGFMPFDYAWGQPFAWIDAEETPVRFGRLLRA